MEKSKVLNCYLFGIILALFVIAIVFVSTSGSGAKKEDHLLTKVQKQFAGTDTCFECLKQNTYLSSEQADSYLRDGIYPFSYYCTDG